MPMVTLYQLWGTKCKRSFWKRSRLYILSWIHHIIYGLFNLYFWWLNITQYWSEYSNGTCKFLEKLWSHDTIYNEWDAYYKESGRQISTAHCIQLDMFLYDRLWIPGDRKFIVTIVIHWWRSTLRQFARQRALGEYEVTVLVLDVRVTSLINYDDVAMLDHKRPSFPTRVKSRIRWLSWGVSWVKVIK